MLRVFQKLDRQEFVFSITHSDYNSLRTEIAYEIKNNFKCIAKSMYKKMYRKIREELIDEINKMSIKDILNENILSK